MDRQEHADNHVMWQASRRLRAIDELANEPGMFEDFLRIQSQAELLFLLLVFLFHFDEEQQGTWYLFLAGPLEPLSRRRFSQFRIYRLHTHVIRHPSYTVRNHKHDRRRTLISSACWTIGIASPYSSLGSMATGYTISMGAELAFGEPSVIDMEDDTREKPGRASSSFLAVEAGVSFSD